MPCSGARSQNWVEGLSQRKTSRRQGSLCLRCPARENEWTFPTPTPGFLSILRLPLCWYPGRPCDELDSSSWSGKRPTLQPSEPPPRSSAEGRLCPQTMLLTCPFAEWSVNLFLSSALWLHRHEAANSHHFLLFPWNLSLICLAHKEPFKSPSTLRWYICSLL